MTDMDMLDVLKRGQTLVIHTETEKDPFMVKLLEYRVDKQTLEVYDTSAGADRNNLEIIRHIHLNECLTIKIVLDAASSTSHTKTLKNCESEDYLSSRSEICRLDRITELLQENTLQLTLTERVQLEQHLSIKPHLIDVVGPAYQQAMEHIELQSMVSLIVCSNIQFFAIATQAQTYIFDMHAFGEVPGELKFVLTSEDIKLIIHDSPKIFARVKYIYGIKLRGVLDTCVAYRIVTGCGQSCSLEEAIMRILRLSLDSLEPSSAVSNVEYCQHLVMLAVHQHKLYQRLVDDCLLHKYNETCQVFSRTIDDIKDNAEAAIIMAEKKDYGFKCIRDALHSKDSLVEQLQCLNLGTHDDENVKM